MHAFGLAPQMRASHTKKVGSSAKNEEFFMPFTTISTPHSPTLSPITIPVATTPIRIWHNSWYQPKIPVPLHQFHTFS